jgi:hypothetical protein
LSFAVRFFGRERDLSGQLEVKRPVGADTPKRKEVKK